MFSARASSCSLVSREVRTVMVTVFSLLLAFVFICVQLNTTADALQGMHLSLPYSKAITGRLLFCAGAALTKIYSLITWIADWRRWAVLVLICLKGGEGEFSSLGRELCKLII